MPQHVVLSNGYKLDIPDGLTNDQISDRVNHMEGLINPQWKGFGNLSDAGESIRNALSYVNDPAGRIAAAGLNLNPAIGGADLTVSGLNALKAVASRYAPSLRSTPDIPTVSGLASSAAGVAPLAPDASPVQRYAEAAATGLVNPRQAVRTGLEMVGATGGGDAGSSIASYYGGPDWSQIGRWFGSLGGAGTARKLNPATSTAGSQAPGVSQSAANISTPENQVQPTYGSMAKSYWSRNRKGSQRRAGRQYPDRQGAAADGGRHQDGE